MKYLALSGSSREDSVNQKTVNAMAASLRALSAKVTDITLNDFDLPLDNGDLESSAGLPEAAQRFQTLIHASGGLIIGCPEYNGYMTPLLLNTIDWSTRSKDGGADLSAFRDRPILITSASPGAMGGARANTQLRTLLIGIGCLVLPDNFAVGGAMSAFDETGAFVDDKLQSRADGIALRFDEFTRRNR